MSVEFYFILLAVVMTLATARITRLLVGDKFPPIAYVRDKVVLWSVSGKDWRIAWGVLPICAYCMGFWVALVNFGLGAWVGAYDATSPVGSDFWGFIAWWSVNVVFALAYTSAMTVARDGDDD